MRMKLPVIKRIARLTALSVAIAGGILGCATRKTASEEATKQWNGTRASVLYALANDQYKNGNFDKSRQTVSEALRIDPSNARLHVLAGKLAIEQGQLELAETELKLARELDPKDAEADYLAGVVCQRWQKPEAAFECYDRAATKDPSELAYVLAKAEMLVVMDRPAEALTLLQDKVLYFEHSAMIRDACGQLLVQQKRYAEAVDMLRQATILATDDQKIREHLGMAMFLNRQYREAADVFARLLKDPKNQQRGDLYLAQGECQLQLKRFVEARGCFETASRLAPSNPQSWQSLTKAAMELNDLKRADLALRRAVALDPNGAETQLLVGYLRLRENKLNEALSAFRRASQLDHNDTVSLCMIGYVLARQGEPQKAMEFYAKALAIKPNDEMASKLMASIDAGE
jgi:superkiller protein 3